MMTIEEIQITDEKLPKYLQLVKQLEDMIRKGDLKAKAKIPSERMLSERLGVSIITVTRAMAELMNRRLIERRVGSGSYVCDIASQGRTSRRIGFFYHHNFNAQAHFMNVMLTNLLDFWTNKGFDLLPLTRGPEDYEQSIVDYNLSGIIIYSPKKEFVPVIKKLRKRQFPIIALSSILPDLQDISYGYSNEAIMEAAVKYLAGLGHRNIALMLPEPNETAYVGRLEGFQKAMWSCRLPLNPAWTKAFIEENDIKLLLQSSPLPDSVILGSCGFVSTFYRLAAELNVRIPDDVSVLSIDESDVWGTMRNPPSSFRIDVKSLTREGAEAMFRIIINEELTPACGNNFEFVERNSCLKHQTIST